MRKKTETEKITLATIAKKLDGVATKTDLSKISKSIDDLTTTVDNLAIATNRGFENAVSKKEFGEFKEEMIDFKKEMTDFAKKTNLTLFNIDGKLQTVDQRLDAIEKILGPLVYVSDALQRELREHERRLSLVEHKIGLTSK